MTNTKHAVLFEEGDTSLLMWIEGKSFRKEVVPLCTTLVQIAELAHARFISHVWVSPLYPSIPEQEETSVKIFKRKVNTIPTMFAASIWKSGWGKKNLMVIFPRYTSWWGEKTSPGWIRDAGPHDILITLYYLEQKLGVTVGSSAGRVGWSYLKKLSPDWLEDVPGVNLRTIHFTGSASADIIWQRPLLSIERRKKYLHKFDKSAAYPYAATCTDIGTGVPVHLEGKDADVASQHEKGHPQEVGVWRCSITYNGTLYNALMPPVWREEQGSYASSEGWVIGPIIRLLRKVGHTVQVHEGWVFPERHDVLVKWANDLWAIRQDFSTSGNWTNAKGAALAARATKQIMNHAIGMTGSPKLSDDDEMKRPDIRTQVIGRHRELTWHNIEKIRVMYGVTPAIVYMDALYYFSDEPSGLHALPELGKRTGKFGGYKWEGRVEVTPDVLAMFDTQMDESERLEFFNKKGWVK